MNTRHSQSAAIGVDFDNTLISYDNVMYNRALQQGLISPDIANNKKLIRDHIRLLPGGEQQWQMLQASAYGPYIAEALLIEGVAEFFEECKRRSSQVYIVSHKTELAHYGDPRPNLRQAALRWMEEHGFFTEAGFHLSKDHVYFCGTRHEKIARISALGCAYFIDDLEEVFAEADFPAHVEKILFASDAANLTDVKVMPTWEQIRKHLFRD